MRFFVKAIATGFAMSMGSALFKKVSGKMGLDAKDGDGETKDGDGETKDGDGETKGGASASPSAKENAKDEETS